MDEHAQRGRRWGLIFAVGYLVFLVQGVAGEVSAGRPPTTTALVLGAVAVFVALYLAFWVSLPYRRGLPGETVALLAVMSAIAVGLTLHEAGWQGLFIYCAVVAGASTWNRRLAVALMAGVLAQVLALATFDHSVLVNLPTAIVTMSLSGLSLLGIGWLIESNAQLRQARQEVERLAVAEERLRFARDLHDLLGHSLSVIVLKAELAGRLGSTAPERAAEEIRDVEKVAREALREVREAVAGYRQLELSEELERARTTLAAAGVDTRLVAAAGGLPPQVDSTLAWALREGVTNILRHSRAHRAAVRLERLDDRVELELTDDGVGCAGCDDGNGLRGLRERVTARDGTVTAGSPPEGGFRLAVSLPLTEAPRPLSPAPA